MLRGGRSTISKVHEPAEGGHGDHEGEEVVEERVDEAVDEPAPVEVLHTLEAVVDVELRGHHDEAEDGDEGDGGLEQEGVPLADDVPARVQRPPEVERHQREEQVVHVPHRLRVDLLPPPVRLARLQPHPRKPTAHPQRERPRDLPRGHRDVQQGEDDHQAAGVVLVDVESEDGGEDEFVEERLEGDAAVVLDLLPEAVLLADGEEAQDRLREREQEVGGDQVDVVREEHLLQLVHRRLVHPHLQQRPHRPHLLEHRPRVPQRVERRETDHVVGEDVQRDGVRPAGHARVGTEGDVHLAEVEACRVDLPARAVWQPPEVHVRRDGVRLVEGHLAEDHHHVEVHRHVQPVLRGLLHPVVGVHDLVDGVVGPAGPALLHFAHLLEAGEVCMGGEVLLLWWAISSREGVSLKRLAKRVTLLVRLSSGRVRFSTISGCCREQRSSKSLLAITSSPCSTHTFSRNSSSLPSTLWMYSRGSAARWDCAAAADSNSRNTNIGIVQMIIPFGLRYDWSTNHEGSAAVGLEAPLDALADRADHHCILAAVHAERDAAADPRAEEEREAPDPRHAPGSFLRDIIGLPPAEGTHQQPRGPVVQEALVVGQEALPVRRQGALVGRQVALVGRRRDYREVARGDLVVGVLGAGRLRVLVVEEGLVVGVGVLAVVLVAHGRYNFVRIITASIIISTRTTKKGFKYKSQHLLIFQISAKFLTLIIVKSSPSENLLIMTAFLPTAPLLCCKTFVLERMDTRQSRIIQAEIDLTFQTVDLGPILATHWPPHHRLQIYDPQANSFLALASGARVERTLLDPAFILLRFARSPPARRGSPREDRSKERTISEAIELVREWRALHETRTRPSNRRKKLTLPEAASMLGVSKKTLDDYYSQLRIAEQHGFDFQMHLNDGVGVLRGFVKSKRQQSRKLPKFLKVIEDLSFLSSQEPPKDSSTLMEQEQESSSEQGEVEREAEQGEIGSVGAGAMGSELQQKNIQDLQFEYYRGFEYLLDEPIDPFMNLSRNFSVRFSEQQSNSILFY